MANLIRKHTIELMQQCLIESRKIYKEDSELGCVKVAIALFEANV